MTKPRPKWTILHTAIAGFVVLAIGGLVLSAFEVYEDCAYICKNTGSRKGYRQWFFGAETGRWYHESELEEFMRANYSTQLQEDWVSYMGTGKNVFGVSMSFGHERPGPIMHADSERLDTYVRSLDDAGKKSLYELFSSGDESRIRSEVEKILLFPDDGE